MNEHYGSIAEGNAYFRLNGDNWRRSTDTEKENALIEATRSIEMLNMIGTRGTGPLFFPRLNETVIPPNILYAVYEEADTLLDVVTSDDLTESLRVTEDRFAAVVTKRDTSWVPQHLNAGITNIRAWRYLLPYITPPDTIKLQRG